MLHENPLKLLSGSKNGSDDLKTLAEMCIKETKGDINYDHTLFNSPMKVEVNNSHLTV